MTASREARRRRAAQQAGPLAAKVDIRFDAEGRGVYKIVCSECTLRGGSNRWTTLRTGKAWDNGYMAAMDRWAIHLHRKHPEASAPCLDYLDAALKRADERDAAEQALWDQVGELLGTDVPEEVRGRRPHP